MNALTSFNYLENNITFTNDEGVVYVNATKQSNTWILYAKYQNKGYTGTKTHTYNDSEGKQHTSINTYWTEKGRAFIHDIFTPFRKSA